MFTNKLPVGLLWQLKKKPPLHGGIIYCTVYRDTTYVNSLFNLKTICKSGLTSQVNKFQGKS